MKRFVTILVIAAVFVIIFLALGPFYVLSEGEQAVLLRFGRIVRADTDPGLKLKTPLVDQVTKYPKKILSWDGDAQRIPTSDKLFIWVDTTARWRISDPQKFYESVTNTTQALSRLDDVINAEVRSVISANILDEAVRTTNEVLQEDEGDRATIEPEDEEFQTSTVSLLLSADQEQLFSVVRPIDEVAGGRPNLSNRMLGGAQETVPEFGIELIDVVIRQIKYSDELTESVYQRMITERKREAQEFRSKGEGAKAAWIGEKEKKLLEIISGARETAEIVKGEGDARAASIYADAYREDLDFYQFWKATEAYRTLLPKFTKTLTTDAEFFNYLYNQFGAQE